MEIMKILSWGYAKSYKDKQGVVVVVYSSIFLSTYTFIMSIGKHVNMNACCMIELKCKINESKIN